MILDQKYSNNFNNTHNKQFTIERQKTGLKTYNNNVVISVVGTLLC